MAAQSPYFFVGGAHAMFPDSTASSAGVLTVGLERLGRHTSSRIEASMAQLTGGSDAVQLAGQTSALWELGSPHLAAGFTANGFAHHFATTWSGLVTAGPALVHAGAVTTVLDLDVGAGRRVDGTSLGLMRGTVHLRRDVSDHVALEVSAGATDATTVRYADASAATILDLEPVVFGVRAGVRGGDLAGPPWWQVHAEWHLAPWVSLEAAGGTYPPDLSGFTSGRFASLGLRVSMAGVRPRITPSADRVTAPTVHAVARTHDSVEVNVRFAHASSLAIAGDWNGWTPTPLRRIADDRWTATLPLHPGVYSYSLLADGARWVLPEGSSGLPDGFGGQVGVLVVRPTRN